MNLNSKVQLKGTKQIGTVVGAKSDNTVTVKFEGTNEPVEIIKDVLTVIDLLKKIVEFFVDLFKKKDLPNVIVWLGEVLHYYSKQNKDGSFEVGYASGKNMSVPQLSEQGDNKAKAKERLKLLLKNGNVI